MFSCTQLIDVFLQLDNPLSACCVVYLWFIFIYLREFCHHMIACGNLGNLVLLYCGV